VAADPATIGTVEQAGGSVTDTAREALEDLYHQEYEGAVRLAHALVGDRARAEELAQDAFVRTFAHIEDLDHPGAYLRTVLVNLCRDAARRSRLARRHPDRPDPGSVDGPVEPTDATAVWQALRSLPERQRTAVVLRFYLDLPTDQIAELLGARPATVRSLVHRALTTLKETVSRD
jgi:RNA polymerase sigma-70 factor (sigma-E family)